MRLAPQAIKHGDRFESGMMKQETIFAQASGPGVSGVAVIRLSGPRASAAAGAIAGPLPPPRLATLRWFADPASGEKLDRGLMIWMPGPASFTGEDSAEFHIHGSRAVADAMLAALGGIDGLRLAEPGEFSLRAFRNGKFDLVAAEGLVDLIAARTVEQRRAAMRQALGGMSATVESWRGGIVRLLAHAEAAIDFADEDAMVETMAATIREGAATLAQTMVRALEASRGARLLRDGVRVVIAGPPNAGKSSLLNALAGRDAAIVSSRPGTTRDVVEAQIDLGGVPVILSDTAGLRGETTDEIEILGMDRTRSALADAEIVLRVASPDTVDDAFPIVSAEEIAVFNKCDLAANPAAWRVSARTGEGIPALREYLTGRVRALAGIGEAAGFTRERQESAGRAALMHLRAAAAPAAKPMETLAEELRAAAHQIGRISGRVDVEDLLDTIFSDFCIGK
jgi:tRNA modification GTPase